MYRALSSPSTSAPRIFHLQVASKFDLSSANKFGKLELLLPEYLTIANLNYVIEKIRDAFARVSFDPAIDYILIAGHVTLTACLLTTVIFQFSECKTLVFDARVQEYVERMIKLED